MLVMTITAPSTTTRLVAVAPALVGQCRLCLTEFDAVAPKTHVGYTLTTGPILRFRKVKITGCQWHVRRWAAAG